MIYEIRNDYLTVRINSIGAELDSIRSSSGREYLWQGNPEIWAGRAPNLFPFVARLRDGQYEMDGKTYSMKIHGFARGSVFTCSEIQKDKVRFELEYSDTTMEVYPRKFRFSITYFLSGSELHIVFLVENMDEKMMYFGIGGHPGFNIPFEEDKKFEDYAIVFSEKCTPRRVVFSERTYVDHVENYVLEDDRRLPLRHDLFDFDAIVLTDVSHDLKITSSESGPYIRVHFPGMNYVGFWHKPRTTAPYVCVEPWVSLPGDEYEPTVFEKKEDLVSLSPGNTYRNEWFISIKE